MKTAVNEWRNQTTKSQMQEWHQFKTLIQNKPREYGKPFAGILNATKL